MGEERYSSTKFLLRHLRVNDSFTPWAKPSDRTSTRLQSRSGHSDEKSFGLQIIKFRPSNLLAGLMLTTLHWVFHPSRCKQLHDHYKQPPCAETDLRVPTPIPQRIALGLLAGCANKAKGLSRGPLGNGKRRSSPISHGKRDGRGSWSMSPANAIIQSASSLLQRVSHSHRSGL
jgi:hypothetical protein